jgi:CDP-diacylglycerol--glycerol-3-phosphate 3-phosphatidyltransferase
MRINKRRIEKSTDKFQVYYQSYENWNKLSFVEKWLINNTGKLNKTKSKELQDRVNRWCADGLDGYAARIRKEITTFGKWFDPFADKVLIILTLVVLAHLNRGVPWLAVWIISFREVLITILRYFAGKKGLTIAASPWGKFKTLSQIIAISLIMLAKPWHIVSLSQWVLWLAVLLTIWSGIDYLWRWRSVFFSAKPKDLIV